MGAVAIVALLAGGPLGMCLAIAYGITHLIKVAKVDAAYAAKGETPPTHRLIEKWLDGRKARGEAPKTAKVAKPGSRAYAKQRWQAFWEDLGEKHRETRDAYKKAVADAKANGKPLPPKPTFKESLTGWKWQIDQITTPAPATGPSAVPTGTPANPAPKPAPASPRPADPGGPPRPTPTRSTATPAPAAGPIPDGPNCFEDRRVRDQARREAPTCPLCQRPMTLTEPGSGQGDAANHARYLCEPCGTRQTGRPWYSIARGLNEQQDKNERQDKVAVRCTTCPTVLYVDREWAVTLTDFRCGTCTGTKTNKENKMTATPQAPAQSGEVTGLQSAINYADAVAAAHAAHSQGGGEQYMAALGDAKVGDLTKQSAAAAQEASEIAAGAWRAHAEKLREQLAAKEATTSETGSKEFLLSE